MHYLIVYSCPSYVLLQVELLLNLEELVPPIVGDTNEQDSKTYRIFEWLWEVTSGENKEVSSFLNRSIIVIRLFRILMKISGNRISVVGRVYYSV